MTGQRERWGLKARDNRRAGNENSQSEQLSDGGQSSAIVTELQGGGGRAWRNQLLQFGLSMGLVIVAWDLLVRLFDVPSYLVPLPLDVASTLVDEWTQQLMPATLVTYLESFLGFGLAIAVAVPTAVLITYSRTAERLLYPLMVISQVVPKVAVAPLFIIWFGFGIFPKVIVAFLTAFFVIVVDTAVGLNSVDPNMVQLSRSMKASPMQIFLKVRIPNALPNLFGSLKVGVTLAVVGAVVAEFVGSGSGLGHLLLLAMGALNTPLAFATIALMAFVGVSMYALVEIVERIAIPWRRSVRFERLEGNA